MRAVFVLALVALALMAPALVHGPPAIDSAGYTEIWTRQIADQLARGELYPRWLPDSFEGLGSPAFYFYPPLAFLVAGAVATVTTAPMAIAVAGLLFLFASGLAMYAWLRGKTDWALAGAAAYMAAPYHLVDFYARATLAEFAAFAWLPLIALAIERGARGWMGPLLAVSYAGLVLTHLPVALLTSVVLIPLLVLRAGWEDRAAVVRCAAGGAVGLLLAGLYLAPALTLQAHTLMPQIMWSAHFDAANWSVLSLLGDQIQGENRAYLIAMSWLAAGWAAMAGAAMLRGGRFWPAVTLWAAACSLGLVPLTELPVLEKVQFPWRALAIVEFAAITAAALWRPRPLALAVAAALLLQGAWPFLRVAQETLGRPLPEVTVTRVIDAVEYLPAGYRPVPVDRYPRGLSGYRGPLVQGPAEGVRAGEDGSVTLRAAADGVITIRRAAFPRWQVTRDGREVPLRPGALVSFRAEAGETYRLAPVRTPAETLGLWLSVLGIALLALWAWRTPRRA